MTSVDLTAPPGWRLELWIDPSREAAADEVELGADPEPLRHSAATWLSTGRYKFALLSRWDAASDGWEDHEDFVKPELL